jgi:ferric iron reductase protein FhuF
MVWYISLLTMPTALQIIVALASSESDSSMDRVVKRRRDDDAYHLFHYLQVRSSQGLDGVTVI